MPHLLEVIHWIFHFYIGLSQQVECRIEDRRLPHRHRHRHGEKRAERIPINENIFDKYNDVWGPNNRDKRQWDNYEENEVERGPWGPWGSPSPCSRSCGGGVTYRSRECRGNSPHDCTGKSRKYDSCNIN
ncbi:hypothetical protein SK128_001459, partial [Halocaridina rubra]